MLTAQAHEVSPRLELYVDEHEAIVNAVLASGPAAACMAAETHIGSVSTLVRGAIRDQMLYAIGAIAWCGRRQVIRSMALGGRCSASLALVDRRYGHATDTVTPPAD